MHYIGIINLIPEFKKSSEDVIYLLITVVDYLKKIKSYTHIYWFYEEKL